ncbi:iron-containing redox enzyme family protein [Iamia majanohamensis]|uniref:Iron-containing redox enzyme family protein n=1 Tax=Iamia majanohamensis TaxID=467976 RepID=A0AAE9Y4C3_9ACTN|nr:iron-containing redox enzyme family protein [Iamia majanohamensis]WCO66034.1 iron-containing redox enzyme family protein [Iamia majanohamensis]
MTPDLVLDLTDRRPTAGARPSRPSARGPLSRVLFAWWDGRSDGAEVEPAARTARHLAGIDPLVDDDLHLALWACYQLHYGGLAGVDDDLEWDPATLGFRARLEAAFEGALRAEHDAAALPADAVAALEELRTWAGPPLARTVEEEGTLDHLREFAVHRSAYQLKEADPHTFGLPRLRGPGRAAMVEIQADEYGDGVPGEAHCELFAAAMDELGLSSDEAAYVGQLPGVTLATDNLVSMFGLHRRLRGALVGHLALFEMCSVVPMGRYLAAARRIGGLPALERFYRVHVEVDEHHARLALDGMVRPMVAAAPELGPDVVLGAAALSRAEARLAAHLLRSWDAGTSSLRTPLARTA